MWFTVFIMALAVCTEPFRLGMTVVMLNRPRPLLHLFVFLCGGFIMGMTVGLVVLFVMRSVIVESADLTLPIVQIVIGVLAWVTAAFLILKKPAVRPTPAVVQDVDQTPASTGGARGLLTQARNLLNGHSPVLAGVAGVGIALPSIDYLAALAVILASGVSPATEVGALLMFNVIALALVEIPLAGYLFAPEKTTMLMTKLNDWMTAHRRRSVAAGLAVVGGILVISGVSSL